MTSVFEASLEDLLCPAHVLGKRIRCRLDGSRFFKIHLDEREKEFMNGRLESICALYKKIT
ncbi:MAG: hypothetical protein ACK52J_03825 [bacterium]